MQMNQTRRTDLQQAQTIRLKSGNRVLKNQLNDGNPDDLYHLRLNRSSAINLQLRGLRADADLTLLNRRGRPIAQSKQSRRANDPIDLSLKQGVYYIRVRQIQRNTRYRLRMSVEPQRELTLSAPVQETPNPTHPFVQRVLDLTNNFRRQAGLQPLRLNQQLNTAAQNHSEHMANGDFFGHIAPDGSTMSDRTTAAGYHHWKISENLAGGYVTPEDAVNGWMNSPGHRANILDGSLQEIGVGYYFLANDTGTINYQHYWTQNFAIPWA
jgi:uncharacterized protein YkwD